jgi:hypothetical protein
LWRGVHPEGIHPERDKRGERKKILSLDGCGSFSPGKKVRMRGRKND